MKYKKKSKEYMIRLWKENKKREKMNWYKKMKWMIYNKYKTNKS